MKRKIKQFNNYKLNNSFREKENFKDMFMVAAYKSYKNIRLKTTWIKSVDKSEIFLFHRSSLKIECNNSATVTCDKKPAIYKVNKIVISEILPRDEINDIHKKLEKMQFKHPGKICFQQLI